MSSDWKYHITTESTNWSQIQDWCETYIGELDLDWADFAQYKVGNKIKTIWCFKKERHANDYE
jgi:hypothetical protein